MVEINEATNQLPETRGELAQKFPETDEIVYETRIGLRPYIIRPASPEVLQQWSAEIDQIFALITSRDYLEIKKAITHRGRLRADPSAIINTIEQGKLSPRDWEILATGIWALTRKSPWHGIHSASWKIMKGGSYPLESTIDPKISGSCTDTAVLIREIAAHRGIEGDLYKKLFHHLWIADSGQVLDVNWAWERAGFFRNQEEFETYVKQHPLPQIHLFSPVPIKKEI